MKRREHNSIIINQCKVGGTWRQSGVQDLMYILDDDVRFIKRLDKTIRDGEREGTKFFFCMKWLGEFDV